MLKLASISALVGVSMIALASPATAQECQPSRMMVLLDKSSSMLNPINGDTKWDVAKDALGQVVRSNEESLEIGLSVFPAQGECSPGQVVVQPSLNSSNDIVSALSTPPPTGGNWTPMAESLEAASQFAALNDPDIPSYVVLITDGWQYCDPYEDSTRFAPVDAVEQLNMAGITTYVVGFGDGVDVATLNKVAVAAGTAIDGCDASGTDLGADDHCYFQADDPLELIAALDAITENIPSVEVCDGVDNDCDGEIDEGLVQACSNTCGMGQSVCSAGAYGDCETVSEEFEVCDGIDNDCDGTADEPNADGTDLCGPDATCNGGECIALGGAPSGCGCDSSQGSRGALGVLLPLLLGLFAFRRKRLV